MPRKELHDTVDELFKEAFFIIKGMDKRLADLKKQTSKEHALLKPSKKNGWGKP